MKTALLTITVFIAALASAAAAQTAQDNDAARVIAITAQDGVGVEAADTVRIRGLETADDTDLLFPYIICPQVFAFYESLNHGLTPDKPNASGTVNRVVQGVRIHELG